MSQPLLDVQNLRVSLGGVPIVRDVSFSVGPGECLALVGESGSGKSVTALSLMGLMPGAAVSAEHWQFDGRDMRGIGQRQWRLLRGRRVAMIFQNPMAALNPTMRIGEQIAEVLRLHRGLRGRELRHEVIRLLERMAIAEPERRMRQYPFEFSGGMLQRVMIAVAVACEPALLIADEPTTALDVTVQAEVLALIDDLRRERGMSVLLITHDLGVVARMADSVAVMYAGELVEQGAADQLFYRTAHPYTAALKAAVPTMDVSGELPAVEGSPPDLRVPVSGCAFAPRCPDAMQVCRQPPASYLLDTEHRVKCWKYHPDFPGRGGHD